MRSPLYIESSSSRCWEASHRQPYWPSHVHCLRWPTRRGIGLPCLLALTPVGMACFVVLCAVLSCTAGLRTYFTMVSNTESIGLPPASISVLLKNFLVDFLVRARNAHVYNPAKLPVGTALDYLPTYLIPGTEYRACRQRKVVTSSIVTSPPPTCSTRK